MRSRIVGGFTLIEVLVAVLVLAAGIVGAAGLQVVALRTGNATGLLSDGVQLSGSLAERMRANAGQSQAGDAANAYLQLRYNAASEGAPAPAGVMCFGGASCNSAQMAAFDLYEIKQALYSDFPEGRVAVCRDAAVWSSATRSLAWECAAGANAPVVIKLGWRDRRAPPDAKINPAVALVLAGGAP